MRRKSMMILYQSLGTVSMTKSHSATRSRSTDPHPSLSDGDKWFEVFQQRGVWRLTHQIVERWVDRNAVFFGMMKRHIPAAGKIIELGCGPGRHALGAAKQGFEVVGIDLEPEIVNQARANARALGLSTRASFQIGDMFNLEAVAPKGTFQAITHGG